jgi:hypothetical protein
VFTYALPSNKIPIVARVGSRGNVFTESLLSNGSIHRNLCGNIVDWGIKILGSNSRCIWSVLGTYDNQLTALLLCTVSLKAAQALREANGFR